MNFILVDKEQRSREGSDRLIRAYYARLQSGGSRHGDGNGLSADKALSVMRDLFTEDRLRELGIL